MSVPSPALQIYGYQQRWLLDQARFKLGMFARQTGKTFTTTLEITDDCFAAEIEGRRSRWVILSRGERQAAEAMNEGIKRHAQAYSLALEDFGETEWKAENGISYKALEVSLGGGSKITALPANPDTARGFSANVFLDEFALHKDSGAIWKALFPVISAGWKLRVTSTPNGKGNKFYELATGKDDGWSRHVVDIYQAVAEGLPRNVEELRLGMNDEDGWQQEFELKWLDEASAWLSYDLITSCEDPEAGLGHDTYGGGVCFLGNDIGRRNDLWVLQVFEQIGDVLWDRERIELKRATFAEQDEALDDVMRRYRVGRLCMDQTGMGEKPVEDAQRRYGSRVEGVLFTGPAKLVMATAGKERFENRTVRIREGDTALRADLHKLRKVASATGAPRFIAERDDDHADRTWAAFLAIHAAGDGPREYAYRAVPRPGDPDRMRMRADDDDIDVMPSLGRSPLGVRLRGGF